MSKRPRLVSENVAARDLGLDLATFRHLVETGHFPQPRAEFGFRHDIKALHAALDRMSGLGGAQAPLDAWMERRHARDVEGGSHRQAKARHR